MIYLPVKCLLSGYFPIPQDIVIFEGRLLIYVKKKKNLNEFITIPDFLRMRSHSESYGR